MDPITAFKALTTGKKLLAIGGIVLVIALLIFAISRFIDNAFDAAEQAGAAKVRAETLETTITRTEEANNAEDTIRNDPAAARDNCVRHSRTPENCQ